MDISYLDIDEHSCYNRSMDEETFEKLEDRASALETMVWTQDARIRDLEESVRVLNKTVEGIQNLFIRAGEYKGKARGRLP